MPNALPDVSALTVDEKFELLSRLTESLRPEDMAISDEFLEELERREEEYRRNPNSAISWDDLKKQLLSQNGND